VKVQPKIHWGLGKKGNMEKKRKERGMRERKEKGKATRWKDETISILVAPTTINQETGNRDQGLGNRHVQTEKIETAAGGILAKETDSSEQRGETCRR
jgi:hypothetical protein